MEDLVLHLHLTVAVPVFIFKNPTAQAFTAVAPIFKRDRDIEMRKLVKKKQKEAARNSKF